MKSIGWPAILAAVAGAGLVTLGLGYAVYHFRMRSQMQQQIRDIMCGPALAVPAICLCLRLLLALPACTDVVWVGPPAGP